MSKCWFCQDGYFVTEFHMPGEPDTPCPFCNQPDKEKAAEEIRFLKLLRIIPKRE